MVTVHKGATICCNACHSMRYVLLGNAYDTGATDYKVFYVKEIIPELVYNVCWMMLNDPANV